ncbi:MAG: VWA domain-containing protein [Halothiobacillus sp.]
MNLAAALFSGLGLPDVSVWVAQTPLVRPELAQPLWLLLLLLPLTLLLWRLRARQRLMHYADEPLQPWALVRQGKAHSAWRQRALWGLMLLFWLCLSLALADPRVPKAADDHLQTRPPLVFLIDDSAAMTVADVSPNRQARAVALVGLLAKQFPDRRLGLMVYADQAGLLLPPVSDSSLLEFFLNQVAALKHPLVAPRPDLAFDWIAQLPDMKGGAVVWLTSADPSSFQGALGSRQLVGAEALKKADLRVIAVTVAGQGGPLLKEGLPVKTTEEQVITSVPAPARVAELAKLTGGVAAVTRTLPEDVRFIQKSVEALPNLPPKLNAATQSRSLHALPLLLAWLSILAAALVLMSRSMRRTQPAALGLLFVFTLADLGIGFVPTPADAAEPQAWLSRSANSARLAEGDAALREGDYARAEVEFAAAKGYGARFGSGLAAFRRADYAFAVDQLQAAVWLASHSDEAALATFNLGNALVMAGRYPAALDAFNHVLSIKPLPENLSHAALYNRDILQKILQTAAINGKNGPKFQGHQIATYGYYQEPTFSKMDKEIQKSSGTTLSAAGPSINVSPAATPFVLNEATATSARAKLNLIHDTPTPLLDGLLGQQPYHRPMVPDGLPAPNSVNTP